MITVTTEYLPTTDGHIVLLHELGLCIGQASVLANIRKEVRTHA
jgi:hypothetical protein